MLLYELLGGSIVLTLLTPLYALASPDAQIIPGQHGSQCMSSSTKTTRQLIIETGKSPKPNHAATIPETSAATPAMGHWVASIIAGNVITASVT